MRGRPEILRRLMDSRRKSYFSEEEIARKRKKMQLKINKKSPTYYKDNVWKGNYSFEEADIWEYKDKFPRVKNAMKPVVLFGNFIILKDSHGVPRFTLLNIEYAEKFVISEIQRERTKPGYEKTADGQLFWNAKKETGESKKFQSELREMHPAEFLLSEFIYRNREKIRAGKIVEMAVNPKFRKNYKILIESFFTKKRGRRGYVLDLRKKRVKAILGLK